MISFHFKEKERMSCRLFGLKMEGMSSSEIMIGLV
jgi:hypothetical protein